MWPTRRWWTIVGVGAVLLGVGVVGLRPLALAGAASLGALCLAGGASAISAFATTADDVAVDVRASPARLPVDGNTTLTVAVSLDSPAQHPVEVHCEFPAGVSSDPLTVRLEPGETAARELVSPSFPIAGRFDFPDLTYTFEGPGGLFTQEVPVEEHATVTVETRGTGEVHVGAGGERILGRAEGHRSDGYAAEIGDFTSLRKYTPSDSVRHIDWKATARLDEPHVRQFETKSRLETRLVVDARSRLSEGEPGRTKLDFAREVALGVLQSVEAAEDPLGLTVVDDTGIRLATGTANTLDQYRRIREELLRLGTDAPAEVVQQSVSGGRDLSDARVSFRRLAARADDGSPFTAAVRPFFERTGSYVTHLSDDQLFEAVRQHARRTSLGTWTVLITDDEDRGSLEETAKVAAKGSGRTTVFVAPTALFRRSGGSELDAAYDRLVDFETFRRRLDRIPEVGAYEIGPDERVQAILSRGRSRG